MPSTPTTKSQVQAYRFVLRRMQSALVRKDAVMLHDPMRTHTRATIVGVCIAAVGVVGFLVWGLLSPEPTPPNEDAILISKQSGQVYVMISNPKQLIPVFNLASARLLLVARQEQTAQQNGQGGANGVPTANSGGSGEAKTATVVDEKELKDIPRGRLTGIRNGPDLLPGNDQRIDSNWAVCDAYHIDTSLPDPTSEDKVETTVLGGVSDLGEELSGSRALLVKADTGKVYLVYATPVDANIRNAKAVRAEVDMTNQRVKQALNLQETSMRRITTGLLNAIPEAPALGLPDIPGRGNAPQGFDVRGLKVGSVFSVERAGQAEPDYYVLLSNGKQRIKRTTADLIRFARSVNGEDITKVAPDESAAAPEVFTDTTRLDDRQSPARQPELLNPLNFPVACLGWNVVGEGNEADEHTAVHVGTAVPTPRKADGNRNEGVQITTPGPDGQLIQHFYMPPGRAAVARGATSKQDFTTGPIYLVSDRGVKYGVPDQATAGILGLTNPRPAPLSIMRLLPDGASLNKKDVLQTYDSIPVAAGVFVDPSSGGG
jgi:type VII secretion protein EccB